MNRIFAILIITAFTLNHRSIAQIRAGLKFGVSSTNLGTGNLSIPRLGDLENLKLSVLRANYGVHAGLWARIKILGLYVQPEMVFNSNSADYKLSEVSATPFEIIKRESYQYVDIPVLLGLKFGPLQLGAGPVGHVFINSTSELFDVDGYAQKFKELTYGYQAQAALVLGKLAFDLRYEGNLSKFGEHIEFFGHKYAFDKAPSRILASIGLAF